MFIRFPRGVLKEGSNPSPSGRGWPRFVPNPTPLPLGEGGRRPGEGSTTALISPFPAIGNGLLAPGHPHPNPLPKGEGVGGP